MLESDLTLIDESKKSDPFAHINFDCRFSRVQSMFYVWLTSCMTW